MRQTAAGTLAFSLFLATLLDPSPAAACGGLPCAERSETQPADGLTNVPLNTEIRVLYFGAITFADDGSFDDKATPGPASAPARASKSARWTSPATSRFPRRPSCSKTFATPTPRAPTP